MTAKTKDPDLPWLLRHIPKQESIYHRRRLAEQVAALVVDRIEDRAVPFTIGVFGGWGIGKTTFLALLARELGINPHRRIIYFNAWKYAGFMEIVPSLVYKVLKYGMPGTARQKNRAALHVLLALGAQYSGRFGEWAEKRAGVDVVKVFKDIYQLAKLAQDNHAAIPEAVVSAYYTQVDRAQDMLLQALGDLDDPSTPTDALVVLIDELDRCDPDEAFDVMKQLRVLFAMRRVPVIFVVAANPEPIGLAIKHRYGLDSSISDYEARRILEKFVDAYEDLSEPMSLQAFASEVWTQKTNMRLPWIADIDAANGDSGFRLDAIRNATALDVIDTGNSLYSNLRTLLKSLDYVTARAKEHRDLLWTLWHLEIVTQIDPQFRRELSVLAGDIQEIATKTYFALQFTKYHVVPEGERKRIVFDSEFGKTLFAIYRSSFWEKTRSIVDELVKLTERAKVANSDDSRMRERCRLLQSLMADYRRMDFVILMSLIPSSRGDHATLLRQEEIPALPEESRIVLERFGRLLSTY